MRYEVREMAFAEILDTGFRLLRDHFVLLTSIAATLYIPLMIARDSLAAVLEGDPATAAIIVLAMALIAIVASPIVGVAVTHAIGEVYLGRDASFDQSIRRGLAIFVPVIGTTILSSLAILGALLLLILPGIWVFLGFMVLSQVMVLEGTFGASALSRSFQLMKGERLRAFGIMLVVYIVQTIIGWGVDVGLGFIPVVGTLASAFVYSMSAAYTAAVSVVLYFDIRCRKEAFEVEQLARIVEAGTARAAS